MIDIESFQGLLSLGRNEDSLITVGFQNLSDSWFLIHLVCVYIDFCFKAVFFYFLIYFFDSTSCAIVNYAKISYAKAVIFLNQTHKSYQEVTQSLFDKAGFLSFFPYKDI